MSIPGSASPLFLTSAAAAAEFQIDRGLRFNSADSAYLNRTPSSAGNRRQWTWSGWVKRSKVDGSYMGVFGAGGGSTRDRIQFFNNQKLVVNFNDGNDGGVQVSQVFRDPSAWYHIVVAIDTTQATASNRVKIYVNGSQVTAFDTATYPSQNYETRLNNNIATYIGQSSANDLYFDGYLAEVNFIDGQALDPTDLGEYDEYNVWQPKAYTGSYGTNGFYLKFADNSSNAALGTDSSGNSNTWTVNNLTADAVTGMPVSAAWTGYAGSTWSSTDTWDSLSDATTNFGNNGGTKGYSSITETWFGTKTDWTGAFGASIRGGNGWALKFSSTITITVNPVATSSIIACASTSTAVSAGTSYTSFPATMTGQVFWFQCTGSPSVGLYGSVGDIPDPSGIDSLIDTPTNYDDGTNVGGNYATFSPIDSHSSNTFANGNLEATNAGVAVFANLTMGFTSGKWYCEIEVNGGGNGSCMVGICDLNKPHANRKYGQTGGLYMYQSTGGLYGGGLGGSFSDTSYGSAYSDGDIIGIGLDMDNGNVRLYVNGTDLGQANTTSLIGARVSPAVNNDTNTASFKLNAGQRPFAYTPPTDHLPLVTTSFADPTIADGSTAFDTSIWSGNSTQDRKISTAFSPDFVWVKRRNAAKNHILIDAIRGDDNYLHSNTTNANQVQANLLGLVSDGYELGTVQSVNITGSTYVGYAWDAGESTVSNTDGSITSSVRASASNGFSVISYTGNSTRGATVGHGLNAVPGFLVVKNRSTAASNPAWGVKHSGLYSNSAAFVKLESTDALIAESPSAGALFNATNPGSSVFTLGDRDTTNANGDNYIAYCWTPVEGFSSFGSYTGNGSADGPFVFTGFRVRWLLLKRTNGTGDWFILDSERNSSNPTDSYLRPNRSAPEADNTEFVDLLSNGFKIRATGNAYNGSGVTVIYAAYAEHPFASNARAR